MTQGTKVIVPGDAEIEFKSSDINLVKTLICMKHRPRRIEHSGGVVTYVFENAEVEDSVRRILTNEDIQVSIIDVRSSDQIWAMNLNRARNI